VQFPRQLQVLIAEDDFLVSQMVRGLLEDLGHTVAGEAADGQEAVDLTQEVRPDVIIMDIEMPGMNGLEATRRILDLCPTPVIILTAYETPELVKEALGSGVGAYLVKPSKIRDIEQALNIALARFDDILALRRLSVELEARSTELREAQNQIKTLEGLLPICASCGKIRDDEGYWQQVETFRREHNNVKLLSGLCSECVKNSLPHLSPNEKQY
jgi:AmiR/NasT family two-component response regulator